VWILAVAQALIMSVTSMVVFAGGIVGAQLAPAKTLSTFPVALMVIGTACAVAPVALLMKRIGRKRSFLFILLFSIGVALYTAYGIYLRSFYLFCSGTFLFGVTGACVMQFRFAAMESVKPEMIPKAVSSVLIGGIASAFIGPEAALLGRDLSVAPFSGSFILVAGLFFMAFLVLLSFRDPVIEQAHISKTRRSIKEIAKQHVFWVAISSAAVGYVIMSFIMTATPVSMHVMDGHSLQHTKFVIQSHVVAMYLPSLVTAWISARMGIKRMLLTGLLSYVVCIGIAVVGHHLSNYWISLILLGVGWNFLFIGGTALLPRSYRPEERFKVQAVNEFVVFGSQAIASVSAGWVVFALGWESLLLATLPLILLQFIVTYRWLRDDSTERALVPEKHAER
jgi:MFS family permease